MEPNRDVTKKLAKSVMHFVLSDCMSRALASGHTLTAAPRLVDVNCADCQRQLRQMQAEWFGATLKTARNRWRLEEVERNYSMWKRSEAELRRTYQTIAAKIEALKPYLAEAELRALTAQRYLDEPDHVVGSECPKCRAGVVEVHGTGAARYLVCSIDTRCDFKAPLPKPTGPR